MQVDLVKLFKRQSSEDLNPTAKKFKRSEDLSSDAERPSHSSIASRLPRKSIENAIAESSAAAELRKHELQLRKATSPAIGLGGRPTSSATKYGKSYGKSTNRKPPSVTQVLRRDPTARAKIDMLATIEEKMVKARIDDIQNVPSTDKRAWEVFTKVCF